MLRCLCYVCDVVGVLFTHPLCLLSVSFQLRMTAWGEDVDEEAALASLVAAPTRSEVAVTLQDSCAPVNTALTQSEQFGLLPSGLSALAIVLIVVACILVTALTILLVWWCCCRKRDGVSAKNRGFKYMTSWRGGTSARVLPHGTPIHSFQKDVGPHKGKDASVVTSVAHQQGAARIAGLPAPEPIPLAPNGMAWAEAPGQAVKEPAPTLDQAPAAAVAVSAAPAPAAVAYSQPVTGHVTDQSAQILADTDSEDGGDVGSQAGPIFQALRDMQGQDASVAPSTSSSASNGARISSASSQASGAVTPPQWKPVRGPADMSQADMDDLMNALLSDSDDEDPVMDAIMGALHTSDAASAGRKSPASVDGGGVGNLYNLAYAYGPSGAGDSGGAAGGAGAGAGAAGGAARRPRLPALEQESDKK